MIRAISDPLDHLNDEEEDVEGDDEEPAMVAQIDTSISPTGFVAVKKGLSIENCIFLSWDDAKSFLGVSDDEKDNVSGIEYKIVRTLNDAKKYLLPEIESEEDEEDTNSSDARPSSSTPTTTLSPSASTGYAAYPYMYGYPPPSATSQGGGPKDFKGSSSSGKRKAPVPGPEETKMSAYQGYPYYGYPYYPPPPYVPPYTAATSSSKKSSSGIGPVPPSATPDYKRARTTADSNNNMMMTMPPPKRHRPPLPPMAYNGWNNPIFHILTDYFHLTGTCKLLFRPTLEAVCKIHSEEQRTSITRQDVMEWMKVQRVDYHTMSAEQRERTATFDLLAKIDFPFGNETNYDWDTTKLMVASKVQRRKAPFLGIVSQPPTLEELEEGVAAQRQGPVWDCMYLAMSDYVKLSSTLSVIEPTYMTVILRQFAKDGDESILTLDHLLTWMNAQRTSYRDTTVMINAREIAKATSKLSCLQTVGFDWEYEARVVDAVLPAAAAAAEKEEKDVEAQVKKEIEDYIFSDGDNFLVRTDQGAYYKAMKEIPNDPNARGALPTTRSTHLPVNVEKAILRSMLPPQNQIQFSHICNLNLQLFGYPEDKLRKACTNRRKYLEKVEQNNPDTFARLVKNMGLPDGNDFDVGDPVANQEMEILLKGYAARSKNEPVKDKLEKAILRSFLPPRDQIPFGELTVRNEKIFGPPNSRILRAAKKRRKDLEDIQRDQPQDFFEHLKKHGLDQLTEAENAVDADMVDDQDVEEGDATVVVDGTDDVDDDDDDTKLFWNKPGSNILADKETQRKYRMQRNPLPLETDKLLCKHVLGGDHRFALLCNSRPSLFGLPNSRERRKIDDRRRLLREMMAKRPLQFVDVCKAHGLEEELKQEGLLKDDGTLNEAVAVTLAAGNINKGGGTDYDDIDGEDKSPTKAAAISLQALRRKGIKMPTTTSEV